MADDNFLWGRLMNARSSSKIYDVIIVGAGPSGAALARILGRERSVLLLEGRCLGTAEDAAGPAAEKCCGGLLAPDAAKVLARAGLSLPPGIIVGEQPLTVRAVDLASGHERSYPRTYINMRRLEFERWLLSLLPEGATVRGGSRCLEARQELKGREMLWRVRTSTGENYTGRLLVGADGANSFVRRAVLRQKPKREHVYLAVQDAWPLSEACRGREEYLALFHPELTDFYAWAIPKNDRLLVGAAFPPTCRGKGYMRPAAGMEFLRAALLARGYPLALPEAGGLERQSCLLLRPGLADICLGRAAPGEAPVFCIGEAAGWISPSSAEGFSYAFISAAALAGAVLNATSGSEILHRYGRATRFLAGNIAWKKCKSVVMYTPFLRRLVMRSGILGVYNTSRLTKA